MKEKKDQVLAFVKQNGPVLPIQISKNLELNMIFSGAILAELVSNKLLKLTKAKIGSSPLYYAPGQESKLGKLRDHLSQRPKQAYDLIKENRILRDNACEPWQRVALRDIKDFAIPLRVNLKGIDEIFWKWHLVQNEEAKETILKILKEELPKESSLEEKPSSKEETSTEPSKPEKIQEPSKEKSKQEPIEEDVVKEEPPKKTKREVKEEKQTPLTKPDKLENQGEFYETIMDFISQNRMNLHEQKVIRKNREANFIVTIPSAVGNLSYFVKAKNKKKINEGELLLAFNEAMHLKLPLVFLTTGEMTKKADKYVKENIRGLVFKKL